jgi:manganese transport protein
MAIFVTAGQLHPGQWTTNIASGAQFGTGQLAVLLSAHILTLLMQLMAFTLGMHTGQDLIQLCRAHYPQMWVRALWMCGELALLASDIAAILALTVAGQLLFGWTLSTGIYVAAAVVVSVWCVHDRQQSWRAGGCALLLIAIGVGMAFVFSKTPVPIVTLSSMLGVPIGVHDPYARYLALAIVGATTLPHTIFLATYLGQTLSASPSPHAGRIGTIVLALGCAGIITVGSMLIPASAFHGTAYQNIASIADAYALLLPVTGTIATGFVLGFVVLATALVAIMTNTRIRQVTWASFFEQHSAGWSQHLYGMGMTIIPVWFIAQWYADADTSPIIVQSQLLLLIPLLGTGIILFLLTGNPQRNGTTQTITWMRWGRWLMVALGVVLSGYLLWGIW